MTGWSEALIDSIKKGNLDDVETAVGTLEVHPEGPVKSLTTCSGVKAPVFNGRLFNGWQIGDKIANPNDFPEDAQC